MHFVIVGVRHAWSTTDVERADHVGRQRQLLYSDITIAAKRMYHRYFILSGGGDLEGGGFAPQGRHAAPTVVVFGVEEYYCYPDPGTEAELYW